MVTLTFDLETRKLASDLPGGWEALKRGEGGMSCLVAWSSAAGRPLIFDSHTLSNAVQTIENADVVLSFNGIGFDIPILEGLSDRKLALKAHLDLLALIWEALADQGKPKKGNSLGECATRTLGTGKNGDGILAPALADEGRWGELIDYCLHDVHLTRKLFLFAQEHGGIIDATGELLYLNLPDWFGSIEI